MVAENAAGYERRRGARRADPPALGERKWRRRLTRGGLGLLLVILLALGAWMWRMATRVQTEGGRIQAPIVKIAPMGEARLAELLVQEGDSVVPGQRLALLDDREARAELAIVEADLELQRHRLAEAEAEAAWIAATQAADFDAAQASVQMAEARLREARTALAWRETQIAGESRRAQAHLAESQALLARLRRGARPEDIATALSRLDAAQAVLGLRELEARQSRELVAEGIDSEHLLEVRRTQLRTQQAAVREAELAVERLQAGALPEELEAAAQVLAAREAELALTQTATAELISLQAIAAAREAELTRERSRFELETTRRQAAQTAQMRVQAATAAVSRAAAVVTGRQAVLEGLALLSPVAGTVTRIFPNVGDLCRRGEPILWILDHQRPRWIEAYVRESDAMRIQAGQPAWVRIPSQHQSTYLAEVAQVGLHTQALEPESAATGVLTVDERVWVKLVTHDPLPAQPVTGTRVRAVIRVFGRGAPK